MSVRFKIGTAVAVAVLAVLGLVGFIGGRQMGESGPASAEPGPVQPPGPEVTPVPGATPDTAQNWWYLPYQYEEDRLPRYDQVVAGIALGPRVAHGAACQVPLVPVSLEAVVGSLVEIRTPYLPEGTRRDNHFDFGLCLGQPAFAEIFYWIPVDEEEMARVKNREISFFDAQHGGSFQVMRLQMGTPAWQTDFPSARVEAGTIAGRPAAIGSPLFKEGWGRSELYVWDPQTKVLTVVRGDDISLSDLKAIGEGLFE